MQTVEQRRRGEKDAGATDPVLDFPLLSSNSSSFFGRDVGRDRQLHPPS